MSGQRIGIFDSGFGGLTVISRLLGEASQLGLHYFADTANVPYGDRSPSQVRQLSGRIVKYLVESGAAAIVMACNTATALSLDEIRRWCPVPVVGIIRPAVRAALAATRNGRIGVIANPLTAASGAYQKAAPSAQMKVIGCPDLVSLIESGQVDSPTTRQALAVHLAPLKEFGMDTLIFGCTHFPFLRGLVADYFGSRLHIIDPGAFVVDELKKSGVHRTRSLTHLFEVSGDPVRFGEVGSRLIGRPLGDVRSVCLDLAVA